ncbi:hypothetical protein GII30_01145 [Gordonia amarae]|uniref:Uncharacterized protein n=2 Tax=Gordonia amarae TaxID=36821 RepID=G7GUW3_9ACTN|nr:hypothetical protein [Gordonia amarae]MCS3876950.1 hypothetical protein [Gordonia amarae]QHN15774.1 hypothetical protein GII35_01145 [Gordonia amarae]QHN20343.1 hypothetical protein GII34_01145 [Gordonia amarae]QHN29194.1 hypothetical protein GII32_01150 [Gordonia amarae]QHN37973.1 hypothetical protein GII30_01145 [Gordonia amarae]
MASRRIERLASDTPFQSSSSGIDLTVTDFWSWAGSDLLDNSLRGQLAEFIVGSALGCVDGKVRREWDAYDLLTPDGIKVEVKSTAYLQAWGPTTKSSIKFSVGKSRAWDAETNTYDVEHKRSSDVYVFCYFACEDRKVANPLNLDQWEFYVVPTSLLEKLIPEQKSISLTSLLRLTSAPRVAHADIAEAVRGRK